MPFTCDSRSMLEQGLVVTMHGRSERHVTPSAHRTVATLMAETAPAVIEVPDADSAEENEEAGDADAAGEAGGAAAFEALMASDLAWFEGGQRVKGMAEDHQLEALARLHATALAELEARHSQSWVDRTPLSAREAVVLEVATATGLPTGELAVRLELATASPARTRFLREQIRTGATTVHRACEIVRETRALDDESADHIARTALAPTRDGAGLSGALFRQRLRRALLAADTDQAARRRAARERIGAHAEVFDDGTGRLTVTNDADKIVAAIERADTAARAARAAGDPRTLEQLRADYLTGVAITGWPDGDAGFAHQSPSPAGQAVVVVPFETALGLSDLPCELPGHGFISAQQAREIITAPGSIWQTLLADPTTGRALALSPRGYRPTREMIEHVRAVDGTCRGPGCTVPARRCDLDHDVPWPHGPTHVDNLTAKDRQHHRVKTAGWWHASRDDGAIVTWHTAAGRTYATHPKDWLEGHHPDDTPPDAAAGRATRAAPATTDLTALPPTPAPDPPPF
ncbi:MAG TPA: HNH endonuclease signature motif containing protein [Humibacillus sp.]|nr:HNH endonuclease signature motif containing protein [Humibacillus sp.]